MSPIKHTPGPWTTGPGKNNTIAIVAREQETRLVANVSAKDRPIEETDANANLIASAPDLLAACQAVLAWATRECMPQGGKNDGPWEAVESAIAKATI